MAKMVDRIRKALGIPARIQGAAYTDEWWGDVPPATSALLYGVDVACVGTDAVRTPTHGVPSLFADLEEIEEEDDTDWEAKLREAKARAAAPAVPKAVVDARPPAPVVAAVVKREASAPVKAAPASAVAASVRKSPFAKKLDFVETPKKPDAASKKTVIAPTKKNDEREPTLKGIPTARIPETPDWMEDDWSKVIERAKEKTVKTAAAAPRATAPRAVAPRTGAKRDEEDWEALIRRAKSAVG
jgi:hypothetical protein